MDDLLSIAVSSRRETLMFLHSVRAVPMKDTVEMTMGVLRPRLLRYTIEARLLEDGITRLARGETLSEVVAELSELEDLPESAVLAFLLSNADWERYGEQYSAVMETADAVSPLRGFSLSLSIVTASIAARVIGDMPKSVENVVEETQKRIETLCAGSTPQIVFGEPLEVTKELILKSGRVYLTDSGVMAPIEPASLSWDPDERLSALFKLKQEWPTEELLPIMGPLIEDSNTLRGLENFLMQSARNAGLVDGNERWVSKYF